MALYPRGMGNFGCLLLSFQALPYIDSIGSRMRKSEMPPPLIDLGWEEAEDIGLEESHRSDQEIRVTESLRTGITNVNLALDQILEDLKRMSPSDAPTQTLRPVFPLVDGRVGGEPTEPAGTRFQKFFWQFVCVCRMRSAGGWVCCTGHNWPRGIFSAWSFLFFL